MEKYDVVIIGAGPCGLTAAIYALRSGLSVAIIEKNMIGGQTSLTYEVKNYPGFVSISGMELSTKMHEQSTLLGAVTIYGEVKSINFSPMNNLIIVEDKEVFANTIILSMGARARTLGVNGESDFIGRGICYCAVCDGAIFKDQDVVLVGGGNSAVQDAIYLSNIAKSITIINNLPSFTCQKILLDELEKIMNNKHNININHNSMVKEFLGTDVLSGVKFVNDAGEETTVNVSGAFIAIGREPDTELVRNTIHLDEHGYVAVDDNLETNQPGVFAGGDVRVKRLRQIVTACADGAIAATNANSFINQNK